MTVTSSNVCGRSHPYIMSPKAMLAPHAFPESGQVVTGPGGCERIGASPRRAASRSARHCAADSPASLYALAGCWPRCFSRVTFPRLRRRTLIFMTALAVISALVTALCIGYHFGRRAGSTPSTWRKRTSRVALGRLAISLLVLMTVRRIRQSFLARREFPDAVGIWGLRLIAPLGLLRCSVARLGSY